jgi:hypothetical protein
MYDEPDIPAGEYLKPDEAALRGRPRNFIRSLAAAVPGVGFALWLSALLGVGPMDGREVAGLIVTVVAFLLWSLTLGRSVTPR